MRIETINPATEEILKRYEVDSKTRIKNKVDLSRKAFVDWRETSVVERSDLLRSLARSMRKNLDSDAELITTEMGKPIKESYAELEKCMLLCDYYAKNAEKFLEEEIIKTEARKSYVTFEPLGVVACIMPWNFPFWQVIRFAAPALAAGNVALLKHASNVPRCALALEDLFRRAGAPPGVFQTLLVASSRVETIIGDGRVAAVTLTGSTPAGRSVAATAGRFLKKTVLELGGSDPFIVAASADIERAAETAVAARIVNNGQSCIAAKRFIVVEPVADRFIARFVEELRARRVGDPLARETQVGPLARVDLRDSLHEQVEESVKRGAQRLLGGEIPQGRGAYYPPTLLAAVDKGMPAFDEETFGPVAAVIRARDEADAVRLANDSPFGLGASLWTRDRARAGRLAPQIEAGSVFVNALVRSDPRLPFGGVKHSGNGRELGEFGIREFVNIKTVWIK